MSTVLERLRERVKELNCLYKIDVLLRDRESDLENIFWNIIDIIPPSWQFPDICRVKILFEGKIFSHHDYVASEWLQTAELVVDDSIIGEIGVIYTKKVLSSQDDPFLPEEQKLLNAIASMVSRAIFHRRLSRMLEVLQSGKSEAVDETMLRHATDRHWKWRYKMASTIAEQLNMESFGVDAIFLIGSVKNATAGPASDIDLLVHFTGNSAQRRCLESWFEGWSLCLCEINFSKTGYRAERLLDVHIVTDHDIERKTSFAVMISAIDNPARLLRRREGVLV